MTAALIILLISVSGNKASKIVMDNGFLNLNDKTYSIKINNSKRLIPIGATIENFKMYYNLKMSRRIDLW